MAVDILPRFMPLFQAGWDNIVMFDGRGSAKSVHGAAANIWLARRRKVRNLYLRQFGASNDQSTKAQLEIIIDMMGIGDEWKITKGEIEHKKTGAIIFFRGLAVNPNNVKSIPNIDWATFEECEDAEEYPIGILRPTIRKVGSRIIWIGNPRTRTNPVAQIFIENEPPPNTCIIRSSYLENPYVSEKFIREAEDMKIKYPHLYKHIYLGQYLDVGECVMVRTINYDPYKPVSDNDVVVFGVDIAREGGDKTVIAVRKGHNITDIISYDSMDLDKLVSVLNGLIYTHKPNYINVDSTGHGAWVPDALKLSGIKVVSVNFASKARNEKLYTNKRTELYGMVQEYFDKGGAIPRGHRALEDQLKASHYTLDSDNRYKLLPKTEIKKMIGNSPDEGDAVGLSMVTPSGEIFNKSLIIASTVIDQKKRINEARWNRQ